MSRIISMLASKMLRYKIIILCLMALFLLPNTVYAANSETIDIDKEKLSTFINSAFTKSDFNGYVIVIKDGERLFSGGNGKISHQSNTLIDEDTVFGIASITKPLTAIGIALLEQRDIIQYADTIDKYIENVPEEKRNITIHQLLTHTSGIVNSVASDTEYLEKQELVSRILESELMAPPGDRYDYSNAGYSLLAAIIENASGKPYTDFMVEEVFKPLGMENTGMTGMSFFQGLNVTNGYYNGEDYGKLSDYTFSWNGLVGNGDVLSTPTDMNALFKNLFEGKLLTSENLGNMLFPHVSEGDDSYYGYGWNILSEEEHGKIITHNGGGLSGNHIVTKYEKYDLSILVFNNRIEDRYLFDLLPYYIDYPADQLSEAVFNGIFTGEYDKMPVPELPLWLGILFYIGIIILAIIFVLVFLHKRKKKRTGAA